MIIMFMMMMAKDHPLKTPNAEIYDRRESVHFAWLPFVLSHGANVCASHNGAIDNIVMLAA